MRASGSVKPIYQKFRSVLTDFIRAYDGIRIETAPNSDARRQANSCRLISVVRWKIQILWHLEAVGVPSHCVRGGLARNELVLRN